MIRVIAAAMALLGTGAANALLYETYQYKGVVQWSDMAGVSAGSQFSGTIGLDLRGLGPASSTNAHSSVWSNESGCKEFVNGQCSHAPFDEWPFLRISLSVDGNAIPVQIMSYSRSELGQYASPHQTGYQLISYTGTTAIAGDFAGGNFALESEFQELEVTLTSLLHLFDDFHDAAQPDLTVPLNGADFSYRAGIGRCATSHYDCDFGSGVLMNSSFGGEITSIQLFGQGHEAPEPGGLVWPSLALVGAGVARRARGCCHGAT